jgi:hypothetical protein
LDTEEIDRPADAGAGGDALAETAEATATISTAAAAVYSFQACVGMNTYLLFA